MSFSPDSFNFSTGYPIALLDVGEYDPKALIVERLCFEHGYDLSLVDVEEFKYSTPDERAQLKNGLVQADLYLAALHEGANPLDLMDSPPTVDTIFTDPDIAGTFDALDDCLDDEYEYIQEGTIDEAEDIAQEAAAKAALQEYLQSEFHGVEFDLDLTKEATGNSPAILFAPTHASRILLLALLRDWQDTPTSACLSTLERPSESYEAGWFDLAVDGEPLSFAVRQLNAPFDATPGNLTAREEASLYHRALRMATGNLLEVIMADPEAAEPVDFANLHTMYMTQNALTTMRVLPIGAGASNTLISRHLLSVMPTRN